MTPWVLRLILANVIMFVLSMLRPAMTSALMLVPALVLERPWTPLTYMFLHGDMWHLLFNLLGLFFFGPRLEYRLGSAQFLWLYFLSGLMGAILSFVFTPFSAIIGASGAVYGVFIGFAYYWPREVIHIWGIFPIEARWLVVLMTALSLFGGFSGGMDNVAHFAHLGGFVGGYFYLRWIERQARSSHMTMQTSSSATGADLQRWKKISRDSLHEVNRDELDRIMKKIEAYGVSTLTPDERLFLDRFSQ